MPDPMRPEELGAAELEWIRDAYAQSQTVVDGIVGDRTGPYAKDSGATAIRDVGRLLAEMDRRKAWLTEELRGLLRKHRVELAARDRTVEALTERSAAYKAELDRVIREAAADKAKLADAEAQIEAGRRVEKGEPCPECGGTVSPFRDVWGREAFKACTSCTWPLPGPDGAPRTAPELPRPPAEEMAPEVSPAGGSTGVFEPEKAAQAPKKEAPGAWIARKFPDATGDDYYRELAAFDADKNEYCQAVDTEGCSCVARQNFPALADLNRWCREHGILALVPAELTQSVFGIRGGEPCITGTRVPVEEVAGYLADGAAWDEVCEMLPSLPPLPVPSTEAPDHQNEPEGAQQ